MEDLKDKLTEAVIYDVMHKALKIVFDDVEWYTIICAVEDSVYLEEDSTGEEVTLTYAELLEEISAVNYNVSFYKLTEVEI